MFGRAQRIVAVVSLLLGVFASARLLTAPAPAPVHVPALGVYAGPGAQGVSNAAAYGKLAGATPSNVLDFAAGDNWTNITGPSWLLQPHESSTVRLEYSLPMLPNGSQYTLAPS